MDLKRFLSKKTLLVTVGSITGASVASSFVSHEFAVLYQQELSLPYASQALSRFSQTPATDMSTSTEMTALAIHRNLFNPTGEIPYEDTIEGSEEMLLKNFDSVPCSGKESDVPVALQGIIYLGDPQKNLATFKDPNIPIADVYKAGDTIIDFSDYVIYKIPSPGEVQIKNGRKKICIYLIQKSILEAASSGQKPPTEETQTLEQSEMSGYLGQGFSTAINAARLVPNMDEETQEMKGFKIFGIKPNSLFSKIGLRNNDVITDVNGMSLTDPSAGFQIYEAFQNESEVVLQVQRGDQIVTQRVVIK